MGCMHDPNSGYSCAFNKCASCPKHFEPKNQQRSNSGGGQKQSQPWSGGGMAVFGAVVLAFFAAVSYEPDNDNEYVSKQEENTEICHYKGKIHYPYGVVYSGKYYEPCGNKSL